MILAISSHFFALTFVGTVSFLAECLMMSSIIIYFNKPKDDQSFSLELGL